ncbi:DUF6279 family lipoprotein [Microbulbifer hydrolyticus]|uniref:Lipoprotein n=1 Tax=Microbulbifer hydrolyticus TaxID=48074 RepID=A0A6P1T8K7_9GAMM|nr:DUF6279 family lipoprotein [Microbulbifer hydrolyticus]MBB5212817.1 hypothetical protein [Microbulbifer hydrolyticus]QHQ38387.1 hypothetical protein GTQ55_04855 [Microbulbifer hydrolyticus]
MNASHHHQRVTRIIGAALALILLFAGGCSSVRLVYGHLDWWMDRNLNKYLDLDGAQEDLLSLRVDEFHRWHRQTQLPRYADYLESLADDVDSPDATPEKLIQIEKQVDNFWHSSVVMLTDLLLPIVIQLDDPQIDQLEENVREEREESLKKWEKSKHKREKQFRKQAERWLGDLTPEQDAMIDHQVATTKFDPKRRDAQRQAWANSFIDTLRSKPEGYEKKLRELLINPQSLWPQDYRNMQDQLRAQARSLASEILKSSTPQQRKHLKSNLLDYAADFRILAAQEH